MGDQKKLIKLTDELLNTLKTTKVETLKAH